MCEMINNSTLDNGGVDSEAPLTNTKNRITLYNVGNSCISLEELTKRYMVIGELDGWVIVKPRQWTRKRKRNWR